MTYGLIPPDIILVASSSSCGKSKFNLTLSIGRVPSITPLNRILPIDLNHKKRDGKPAQNVEQ